MHVLLCLWNCLCCSIFFINMVSHAAISFLLDKALYHSIILSSISNGGPTVHVAGHLTWFRIRIFVKTCTCMHTQPSYAKKVCICRWRCCFSYHIFLSIFFSFSSIILPAGGTNVIDLTGNKSDSMEQCKSYPYCFGSLDAENTSVQCKSYLYCFGSQ